MYDIIIIGSGPAGLTAAIYASRANLQALVVEKDAMGSGQIAVTEQVDNYPGLLHIGGYELGEKFREHAEVLGASFCENEVTALTQNDGSFTISMQDGTNVIGKSVIYAAGSSYRRLEVPGGQLLGVSYCATCDGAFFKGKTTAVAGGGDVALEDALFLARLCKKVYLIHRRDEFRGAKVLRERVKTSENIEILWDTVIEQIQGEDQVESLSLYNKKTEEKQELSVNGVFIAVGILPNTEMYRGVVDLDEAGYVIAGEDGVTSCAGIFAAGDLRTKQLRQVITAAADGANVVTSIEKYLNEL